MQFHTFLHLRTCVSAEMCAEVQCAVNRGKKLCGCASAEVVTLTSAPCTYISVTFSVRSPSSVVNKNVNKEEENLTFKVNLDCLKFPNSNRRNINSWCYIYDHSLFALTLLSFFLR